MIADPAAADMSVNNQFFAADHAHVGQQIGTQHNFVEHKETIYHTSPDDSPDQMHIVARAHLDGGNPRAAEDILRTLHRKGHATPERAYLYVLSILSDRSYGDVTAEQTNEIENATRVVAGEGPGEWQDALDVVNRLLRYAHAEYSEGAVDDEFATALTMFGALSVGRQDEIDTHLSRIVSGAVHEKLAAKRKYQVAEQRMSADRIGRAWKFFEADPLPPGLWVTAPMPATTVDWRDAILGSMATTAAMTVMLTGEITAVLVLVLPLVVAGFFVAVRCMTVWQTHSRYVRSVLAHREPQPDQLEGRFDRLIDQCFREGNHVHLWESSEGYRGYLKRRLQCQYGPYQCHPFELQWLIRWHASRISRGYDYPTARPADAQRAANSRIIGAMVWLVALVASALVGGFWAFVFAVAGWWGISGIARLAAVPRVRRLLAQDAEVVLADEQAEYHRWGQVLADRPSDVEMERWLTLDKAHLKNDALRRANLRERDLVTYVVLIERAPFSRRSRIIGGPPRYAAYMVYIFLLTKFGMRTTRTFLDLTTGDMRNDQHQMCTYDAVASASVTEQGVRTFLADGSLSGDNRAGRVFRLMLLNGTCIAEVREKGRAIGNEPPGVNDDLDDAAAMPTAGFDSALRVLEAVATEGREWIARDRERRQRWARNWCTNTPSSSETQAGVKTSRANFL